MFELVPVPSEPEPSKITDSQEAPKDEQEPPETTANSEENFQQTLSTESMKAPATSSEISQIEEQIMEALLQIKQNNITDITNNANDTAPRQEIIIDENFAETA